MSFRRRPTFRVAFHDKRSPMLRLLQDGDNAQSGMVEVQYDQQWRTLFKAQRLGYVDDKQRITEKGRVWRSRQPGCSDQL